MWVSGSIPKRCLNAWLNLEEALVTKNEAVEHK